MTPTKKNIDTGQRREGGPYNFGDDPMPKPEITPDVVSGAVRPAEPARNSAIKGESPRDFIRREEE